MFWNTVSRTPAIIIQRIRFFAISFKGLSPSGCKKMLVERLSAVDEEALYQAPILMNIENIAREFSLSPENRKPIDKSRSI